MGLFGLFGKKKAAKEADSRKEEPPKSEAQPKNETQPVQEEEEEDDLFSLDSLFSSISTSSPENLFQKALTMYKGGNHTEAFPLFFNAAARGHGESALYCSSMYEKGEGVKKDLKQADTWAAIAVKRDVDGANQAFHRIKDRIFWESFDNLLPKKSQPVPVPDLSPTEQTYRDGMLAYALKDYVKAWKLLNEAADQGHNDAEWVLPEVQGTISKIQKRQIAQQEQQPLLEEANAAYKAGDTAKAITLFEQLAEKDNPAAIFNRALIYFNGEDKANALVWFEKAANHDLVSAQLKCAQMYERGIGTPEDKAAALAWYEKAAKQGDLRGQYHCGEMYRQGLGTAVNEARALTWYERAADQQHPDAQMWCGIMYYDGLGTAVDKSTAKKWFLKAAEQEIDSDIQSQAKELLERFFKHD